MTSFFVCLDYYQLKSCESSAFCEKFEICLRQKILFGHGISFLKISISVKCVEINLRLINKKWSRYRDTVSEKN